MKLKNTNEYSEAQGLFDEFDLSEVARFFGATCMGAPPTGFMNRFVPKAWRPELYSVSHWQQVGRNFGIVTQTIRLHRFPYNFLRFADSLKPGYRDYRYQDMMVHGIHRRLLRWIDSVPGAESNPAPSQGGREYEAIWSVDYSQGPHNGNITMSILPAGGGIAMLVAELVEGVSGKRKRVRSNIRYSRPRRIKEEAP